MLSRVTLVLACLYLVQAGFIKLPQGAENTGNDAAVALSSARACTNSACNRFCVQRGYHWGHCVGTNICRCYRRIRAFDGKAGEAENKIEVNLEKSEDIVKDADASKDFNTQELNDNSDAAVALSSARACTNSACNRFCVQRGYHWGHCVGTNICRCYRRIRAFDGKAGEAENKIEVNLEKSEDIVKDADASKDFNTLELNDNSDAAVALSSARACTNSACNWFCVQRGYALGHCVGTNICRCYRWVRAFDDKAGEAENKIEVNLEQSEDIVKDADASKDFNTQELNDNSDAAVALSSARACNHSACNRFCVQRGYRWGHCANAVCRCYRWDL